jgi:hypothetical protein
VSGALDALAAMPAVSAVPAPAAPAPSADLPTHVNEYAPALRRKREETGVVLSDIARMTGYDIADLLRMESGAIPLEAAVFSRISTAIAELARNKVRR